ncbi:DNA-processing protein DprA [Antiquaquibacter soli]|uniref:DNA-processing protein DprA n=1 Tax=Antiquaquibacter soli TaxID=3064523 RepID=A0ABT9BSV9_9MICO|nr:DNA-processing protein DprA [Protaetiibacter sp. WY-16]MDO7882490.1 DNA-processing protein DprA [Protaetiibacter sp. WY-16]
MFGLKEAEVAELVRAVSSPDLDRDGIEERFARSVWSGLAEPGDRVAGLLVAELGAAGALTALVERSELEAITRAASPSGLGPRDIQSGLDRWIPRLASATALVALRQAVRLGVRLSIPGEDSWIPGVDDLGESAPLALWQRGQGGAVAALDSSIAIVGARAATGYGEHVTMEASAGLVDRGFAIVSGGAYGIDGMAHRAALASQGATVAFLAGGVDRFYPAGHEALLSRIVERGCVIAELPPGAQPTKWRFLQRNRLIAAASQATVVVEAGWRSGALNTVSHALQLGRPVGAVPGPVTSAASAGCHRVIREHDVRLVTSPDEMAELVGVELPESARGSAGDPRVIRLLDALSDRSARRPEELAARSGLSVVDVHAALGLLELDGRVRERERGWVRVLPRPASGT